MKKLLLLFLLILFVSCNYHYEVTYSEKGCVEYNLYQNGIKILTKCLAADGVSCSSEGVYYEKTKESCECQK